MMRIVLPNKRGPNIYRYMYYNIILWFFYKENEIKDLSFIQQLHFVKEGMVHPHKNEGSDYKTLNRTC